MSDEKPELSSRTQTALENAGLTHEDAAKMHPDDLAQVRGIGPVAIGEILRLDRHSPEEAAEADNVHHPVADPPDQDGTPLVPRATRSDDAYGALSHTERINPDLSWPEHRIEVYAAADQPDNVRWPYVLTRNSLTADQVYHRLGEVVWLLPREVSAFHRFDRALLARFGLATEPR